VNNSAYSNNLLFLCLLVALSCPPVLAEGLTDLGPKELWSRALAAYNQNNFPLAIKYFDARSQIQPCGAEVFYYLGNTYLHQKQDASAQKAFKQAVEADAKSQAGQYAQQALDQMKLAQEKRIASEKQNVQAKVPKKTDAVQPSQPPKDASLWRLNETNLLNRRIAAITERAAQTDEELSEREKLETGLDLHADHNRNHSRRDLEIERARVDFNHRWRRYVDAGKIDLTVIDPEVAGYAGGNQLKSLALTTAFGDLSEAGPQVRARAQILFQQLKPRLEALQDRFSRDVYDAKNASIDDVYGIEYHQAVVKRKELDYAAQRKKEKLERLLGSYVNEVNSTVEQTKAACFAK
jgi:hypothetical protein